MVLELQTVVDKASDSSAVGRLQVALRRTLKKYYGKMFTECSLALCAALMSPYESHLVREQLRATQNGSVVFRQCVDRIVRDASRLRVPDAPETDSSSGVPEALLLALPMRLGLTKKIMEERVNELLKALDNPDYLFDKLGSVEDYWRSMKQRMEDWLWELILMYRSIPATSAASERAFSTMGQIIRRAPIIDE